MLPVASPLHRRYISVILPCLCSVNSVPLPLLQEWQKRNGWGELTSNLLLVGQRGNTTPAHYDEQQNIFAQLHGRKRVVLFAPSDFRCLYPFPVPHPNDRQSQVDLHAPDLGRFPRFAEAAPLEALLEPGELLFLPQYWCARPSVRAGPSRRASRLAAPRVLAAMLVGCSCCREGWPFTTRGVTCLPSAGGTTLRI